MQISKNQTGQKKKKWYNYLLGGILGFLLILLLTKIIWPVVYTLTQQNNSITYFIGLNITFIPIIISILTISVLYHRFKIIELISFSGSFKIKRVLIGFTIWIVFQSLLLIVSIIFNKETIIFNYKPKSFYIFLLLTLIFTPLQVLSEELIFRSYLVKFLKSFNKKKIIPLIISPILFALPHLKNPEVDNQIFIFFLVYFFMALLLTWLTLKYNGIEYAFGIHYANNFFALNFLNYPNSPLPTSPLFFVKETVNPLPSLIQVLLLGLITIKIIHKIENYNILSKEK